MTDDAIERMRKRINSAKDREQEENQERREQEATICKERRLVYEKTLIPNERLVQYVSSARIREGMDITNGVMFLGKDITLKRLQALYVECKRLGIAVDSDAGNTEIDYDVVGIDVGRSDGPILVKCRLNVDIEVNGRMKTCELTPEDFGVNYWEDCVSDWFVEEYEDTERFYTGANGDLYVHSSVIEQYAYNDPIKNGQRRWVYWRDGWEIMETRVFSDGRILFTVGTLNDGASVTLSDPDVKGIGPVVRPPKYTPQS